MAMTVMEDQTCALSLTMRNCGRDANESILSLVPLSEGTARCHDRHGHRHGHEP